MHVTCVILPSTQMKYKMKAHILMNVFVDIALSCPLDDGPETQLSRWTFEEVTCKDISYMAPPKEGSAVLKTGSQTHVHSPL